MKCKSVSLHTDLYNQISAHWLRWPRLSEWKDINKMHTMFWGHISLVGDNAIVKYCFYPPQWFICKASKISLSLPDDMLWYSMTGFVEGSTSDETQKISHQTSALQKQRYHMLLANNVVCLQISKPASNLFADTFLLYIIALLFLQFIYIRLIILLRLIYCPLVVDTGVYIQICTPRSCGLNHSCWKRMQSM